MGKQVGLDATKETRFASVWKSGRGFHQLFLRPVFFGLPGPAVLSGSLAPEMPSVFALTPDHPGQTSAEYLSGEVSLSSCFLPGVLFLNKQCLIFRKTVSPPHSSDCPPSKEHFKQSTQFKRTEKLEGFHSSFQTQKAISITGALLACSRYAWRSRMSGLIGWLESPLHGAGKEQNGADKSTVRSLGAHAFWSQRPRQFKSRKI